jgi:hypothetical protein
MSTFEFDYYKFLQGYYSFSQRIKNNDGEQVGIYRVALCKNTLFASFFRTGENWETSIPLTISREIMPATVLVEKTFNGMVKVMTDELYSSLALTTTNTKGD